MTGAGTVPATGVSDVYVVINAIGSTNGGCLDDYNSDVADPGICAVSFDSGNNVADSDIVAVSGSGDISVTNTSSGSADVAVTLMGYYQDDSSQTAGDTYVSLPAKGIVDTRSGLGAPNAQIPAGGTLTVQVAGQGGVPSSAAGAALYIGAANASATGWVSAYPAGGTSSTLAMLSYVPGQVVRDLYFGALSSSGQLTLRNDGSHSVDLMVGVQGYLAGPSATTAGTTYTDVAEQRIVDTRTGTGVAQAQVPAGGSITFTATGTDGVPSAGVSATAESVRAMNATSSGFLTIYAAGTADPNSAAVNFYAGGNQDNGLTAALVSSVSTSGQQTITNHSSGAIDIVVTLRGYYVAPVSPAAPSSVAATVSSSSATVTWTASGSDGGSPITGYTVTASPDNATTTVDSGTSQATLTGLASAASDAFTVTATNAVGNSDGTVFAPPNVVTGTVLAPSGSPVANDLVSIYTADAPSQDATNWSSTPIGTATTNANGNWTFVVPPYSALPSDAQSAADSNGGYLNVEANAVGTATVGATSYIEMASGLRSAWVGTSTQTSGPTTGSTDGLPVMTMQPDNTDLSSLDTTTAETWDGASSPVATDSSNNIVGNGENAYTNPPADSYGYQSLNGSDYNYNPYAAPDGTDLTNVPVTVGGPPASCADGNGLFLVQTVIWKKHSYTIVGEYHSNWDAQGEFDYEQDADSNVGSYISGDGLHFVFNGYVTFNNTSAGQSGVEQGPYISHQVVISLNYWKVKEQWHEGSSTGPVCRTKYRIVEMGLYNPGNGWVYIKDGASVWNHDGIPGWDNYANPAYWNKFGAGWHKCDAQGHGRTYGFAADVGIGIQAETNHTTVAQQCIYFGSANRNDVLTGKYDGWHSVWGSNAKITNYPKTFYNY